jgi:hypothetical protein
MSFLDRFRKKKEDEASRISHRLLRTGRIVEGHILDITADQLGHVTHVFYTYNISDVEYESSQELNIEQQDTDKRYWPGARVVIRYDPRQPANSVVV